MTDTLVDIAKMTVVCAATMIAAACATTHDANRSDYGQAQWAANGWLSPDQSGEPEVIGLYATRRACEAAVKDWMASQVVGNPVSANCLPIDRH